MPTATYWIQKFKEYNIEIGFRYFARELIKSDKVPYPDYTGYFIQIVNKISKTDQGLFFNFISLKNDELRIGIKNGDENEELFNTIQSIISNWKKTTINSGNTKFTGEEFKHFLENRKFPERIEKMNNVW